MNTKKFKNNKQDMIKAAKIIKAGGLVAFPTETVYGLGANALDKKAVAKIFKAKRRPKWDPIISHVDSLEMIESLVGNLPEDFWIVYTNFMPGPITVLLEKSKIVPDILTAGSEKVSIRMPSDKIARRLIKLSGVPIAAPSANLFGKTSPTDAKHVLSDLSGKIDAIIDGGQTKVGVESTVLDLTGKVPVILRPGGITKEELEKVLGKVKIASKSIVKPKTNMASPGMHFRHYAPKAKLILTKGDPESLKREISLYQKQGKRVGVMLPKNWKIKTGAAANYNWGNWDNLRQLAQNVYRGLRFLDDQGVDIIICPKPEAESLGFAINDRLERASK